MLFQFVFLKQDVNFTYFFGKTSFFIQNTINQAVAGSSYIHPCHMTAILPRGTKKPLFYHAKPRNGNHGDEA